jgi:hypothetical protein
MKEIMGRYGVYFCIGVILVSAMVLIYLYGNYIPGIEGFTSPMPDPDTLSNQIPEEEDYLFPVYSLGDMCQEKGLFASDVNRLCLKKDGTYEPLSNCKCEDQEGNCEICYPPVNIDRKGRSVIYNADKLDDSPITGSTASTRPTGSTAPSKNNPYYGFTGSAGLSRRS